MNKLRLFLENKDLMDEFHDIYYDYGAEYDENNPEDPDDFISDYGQDSKALEYAFSYDDTDDPDKWLDLSVEFASLFYNNKY